MKIQATATSTERYELTLAEHLDEVILAQRLRYEVFNLELHEGLAASYANGRDVDEFDEVFDHLIVRDRVSGTVVGTYRMQTGTNASLHRGYYSERQFNFSPYETVRPQIIELGRACVAAAHRNHLVLGMLWKGIAAYAQARGARYLVGCSSFTSQDEAAGLATYRQLAAAHLVTAKWQTRPQPGWWCSALKGAAIPLPVPRLMRAYLALGATICGAPAIDREFGTIDFLTWLDLQAVPARVWQKFLA